MSELKEHKTLKESLEEFGKSIQADLSSETLNNLKEIKRQSNILLTHINSDSMLNDNDYENLQASIDRFKTNLETRVNMYLAKSKD